MSSGSFELSQDLLAGTRPEPSADPVAERTAPPPDDLPLTRILPPSGWQPVNLRELWQFRELLYFLTWRDVKVRYKQTVLGAAWAVLQPAMMMVVFTIFFSRMAGLSSGNLPYPVFCYMGLLPWTFFATAIANAGNSVVNSERLITKTYFPRLAIPFASVGAAVVDFLVAFVLLVALMLWYGVTPTAHLALVPVVFAIIVALAVGVGTLLAALNVAYRDFRYVIPFLVQIWLFGTPTIYMQTAKHGGGGGGALRTLLALYPMTGLIAAFRAACSGAPIDWGQFLLSTAAAIGLFLAGCLCFRRMERNFADVI
jgi:lipopolysaccharide transport system permease protein